jgi:hypothetical protein
LGVRPAIYSSTKVVDHIVAELLADVHDEMVKTEFDGHLPGIVDAVERTAARFFFRTAGRGIIPGFHGNSNDLPALLVEQDGGHGTIDAAGHGDECFAEFGHRPVKTFFWPAWFTSSTP